jgi:protein-S-isoprenylcysteine O-methyltransferase Ste14
MIAPNLDSISLIQYTWEALGIFWLAGMIFTKRTAQAQSIGSRLFHIMFAVPGAAFLGAPWLSIGWLGEHFVPAMPSVRILGLAITVAGCLFAAWARLTLGANWSGRVTLKQSHELITNGPYSLARHPIYTGLIAGAAGTALAIGEWKCIVGLPLIVLAFATKIRQEESMMMQAFPQTYPAYRKRVKALIPGII